MKKRSVYIHNRRYFSKHVRQSRRLSLVAALLFGFAGLYLTGLYLAPRYPGLQTALAKITPMAEASEGPSTLSGDRIVINKLQLNLPFGPKQAYLNIGAWQRYAGRSDPEKGGNTVLAGHRFEIGWTPSQTRAKSPFYRLDKLTVDDSVEVIFKGKTYKYKVSQTLHVNESETWIEDDTKDARLTIYTCDIGGSEKGRLVVIAKPVN